MINKEKFVLPPSSLAINSLANLFNSPYVNLDTKSLNLSANSKFNFLNAVNTLFTTEAEEKEKLLFLSKSYGINTVKKDQSTDIALNSSNSLLDSRLSSFRFINNTRVINRIKKELMINLYTNSDFTVLFNTNTSTNNLSFALQSIIDKTLEKYLDNGSIASFKTEVNLLNNPIGKEEISARVFITLNGLNNSNKNLTNLELNNIISNISELNESFIENLIIVN